MRIEGVMKIFGSMAGTDEQETLDYRNLCEAAMNRLTGEQQTQSDVQEEQSSVEFAAAAVAYYHYMLLCLSAEGGNQIKVGDVSVRYSADRLEYAQRLMNEALSQAGIQPPEGGFVFERMG